MNPLCFDLIFTKISKFLQNSKQNICLSQDGSYCNETEPKIVNCRKYKVFSDKSLRKF